MRTQNVAQRRVDQVRAGMIAHDARAALGIGHDRDAIADMQSFFRVDLVRHEAGDGIEGAGDFGKQLRAGVS